jgi:hypothetical protein
MTRQMQTAGERNIGEASVFQAIPAVSQYFPPATGLSGRLIAGRIIAEELIINLRCLSGVG